MNKQILLILVLAVAWTFSGPAAPGPTDPAGAALAPEADRNPPGHRNRRPPVP